MNYFDKIFKKNKKSNQNKKLELAKKKHEVAETIYDSNFEIMNIGDKELEALKRTFEPLVKEVVEEIERKVTKPEKVFKAIIPPELIGYIESGKLEFMKDVDGDLLPNIVDGKGQIVKKIRLEEIEVTRPDLNIVNQLNAKILNQKLDAISEQLDFMIDLAKEINKNLQNKTYGQVIGAIRTIDQSYLSEGRNARQQLQNTAQSNLNESIAVLEIELEDGIQYFKNWDNRRPFINEYTSNRIKQKFNKLMEDYVHLNSAKSALIELKRKQGMSSTNLTLLTKNLKRIDEQLKDADIKSWVPPRTIENSWQHSLINHIEFKNSRIVVNYNIDELLPEGSESNNV